MAMDLDEIKKKAPLISALLHSEIEKTVDCSSIEDYALKKLGIDKSNVEDSDLLYKNFVHLMIHVYEDIKEIEDHLKDYRRRYDTIQNNKSNKAEFERRKLLYFCDLNKKALQEINCFISGGIQSFLSDHSYDTLKRECEKDGLSDLFYKNRYKFAWYRDYYSIDYPFEALVKISQYVREKFKLEQYTEENQRLIYTYEKQLDQFWSRMDQYIDENQVMQNILDRVSNDYNLYKRQEIFETLHTIFLEGKYQSFITLGLIQIEGLFDDYCAIRYGDSENQGTLVEKAQKTLETNEYNFLCMYPYFAFDVPLLRNEVAHKGILQTENAKRIAYSLVLDLNTLSQMVKSESMDKFIYARMIFDKLNACEPTDGANTDEPYDTLLYELLMFDKMANDHFWEILKNPEDFKEELEFYRKPNLPDDCIDLPGIVREISDLVKSDGFWKALHRLVKEHITPTGKWVDVYDFAKRMKNQYIAILEGEAKAECIEIAKITQ